MYMATPNMCSACCADEAGPSKPCKWRPGRDMWCPKCHVQYCLYCGERLGTLVKWHANTTCEDYLASLAKSKEDAERRQKAELADAECDAHQWVLHGNSTASHRGVSELHCTVANVDAAAACVHRARMELVNEVVNVCVLQVCQAAGDHMAAVSEQGVRERRVEA
jgi:hypothetical protein